jgi:hypothetical protein
MPIFLIIVAERASTQMPKCRRKERSIAVLVPVFAVVAFIFLA